MKYIQRIFLILFYLSIIVFTVFYSCDFFNTNFEDFEDAILYDANGKTNIPPPIQSIKIMTWNIKFGGGRIDFFFDCYGDRSLMKKSEVLSNLQKLTEKINQVDPDILFVQEADICSKRSAYVDQVQWLLDHTNLNYGAYASQWKADYVPSDGVGKINSGNAILSKWKINEALRIALPLIEDQDALTQYFYLRRNILKVKINMGLVASTYFLNTHTSAYSDDGTKKKQIDRIKNELESLETEGYLFVCGGDLNALPPGTDKLKDFDDSKCEEEYEADDYSMETDWLNGFYNDYRSAIPINVYLANQSNHFTHTTDKNGFWNRKLDYIFTNGNIEIDSWITHQNENSGGMNTMERSDHAPVSVELSLP